MTAHRPSSRPGCGSQRLNPHDLHLLTFPCTCRIPKERVAAAVLIEESGWGGESEKFEREARGGWRPYKEGGGFRNQPVCRKLFSVHACHLLTARLDKLIQRRLIPDSCCDDGVSHACT